MTDFDRAMEFVFQWEGGYVDHPNDPGGETNFGISKRAYPNEDIKNLTEKRAKEIYKKDYWNKVRGDDLPGPVALAVMDYAVNSGTGRAAETLQRVVGSSPDGAIGPNTLSAVRAKVDEVGEQGVAREVVMERARFLSRLVKRRTDLLAFLVGWMNRTHSLMAEVASYESDAG